jgi:cation/acetate symporter
MIHEASSIAVFIFFLFVGSVLGLSFYLGRKAKSAQGYYAAHGQIPWFVNGIAFAGDYLSAASFLGICGMIAFAGYDGFLYSIGFLAGWVVALFVIAEPLKKLGKFTFADALDARFQSRGIKITAAVSTLVVSIFYLIPQMVGAGSLIEPLLGWPHWAGVVTVGVAVILIVATAGMVSTTWVQFIKGSLLVFFCAILVVLILSKGLQLDPSGDGGHRWRTVADEAALPGTILPESGPWVDKPYVRTTLDDGRVVAWWKTPKGLVECQTLEKQGEIVHVDGQVRDPKTGKPDIHAVGHVVHLAGDVQETGPLSPTGFLDALSDADVAIWAKDSFAKDAASVTVFRPSITKGEDLLLPGQHSMFKGITQPLPEVPEGDAVAAKTYKTALYARIDFISLMLALFAGTASLPHILIRYYTVKDRHAARKSTVVGIAAIGGFYVLTLYLGLGAMVSGHLDPNNSNMAAPLLAQRFGELPFAIISAIAFTTVLGTVSGLIMAASGAIVHDLITNVMGHKLDDHAMVRYGKLAAVAVGAIAVVLGILFKDFNVGFLVGWAFNVAASANLPALVMLLFWRGTTKQGITWSIIAGLVGSLGWILLSAKTFKDVYHLDPSLAPMPWSQPGIITIPLAFLVLIVVSVMTKKKAVVA